MQTVGNIIKSFKNELKELYPAREIQAITEMAFEHFLQFSKTDLILKADNLLNENNLSELEVVLNRLKKNEPIQHIIGKCYFYNSTFKVNKHVLVPRPETEELVDWIISTNKNKENLNILDIGTGSGCIAISLALNLKNANVYAFDVSQQALDLAKHNAELNNAVVSFLFKDILQPLNPENSQQFDIIISNPPYIRKNEMMLMKKNVLDYEPWLALFVENEDPLLFYKAILNYSKLSLSVNGSLYFEINEAFGNRTMELMQDEGFGQITLKKDINGKDRMISGKKMNK